MTNPKQLVREFYNRGEICTMAVRMKKALEMCLRFKYDS